MGDAEKPRLKVQTAPPAPALETGEHKQLSANEALRSGCSSTARCRRAGIRNGAPAPGSRVNDSPTASAQQLGNLHTFEPNGKSSWDSDASPSLRKIMAATCIFWGSADLLHDAGVLAEILSTSNGAPCSSGRYAARSKRLATRERMGSSLSTSEGICHWWIPSSISRSSAEAASCSTWSLSSTLRKFSMPYIRGDFRCSSRTRPSQPPLDPDGGATGRPSNRGSGSWRTFW
mmetsp:Transcript_47099/g.136912  ORF Transcript_47099/g.136912 Transcript_47099/m.136912 type:complete len:232 (-) Transcript_47099:851-1546(-)